ncbi:MAG: hypothetical protein GY811_22660 [Myxococcales bacterium]|nr:hypothetical protein [Myxococcales bacterium]
MKRLLLLGSMALAASLSTGCKNPEVPAGHEGYIYYTPLIFGKMEYRQSLPGPATTGVSWRLYTTNIDMRARSYKEAFELLTKENLTVSFEVNARLRLRRSSVKDIVENWGGVNWYEWNVKERMRTTVREQVTQFSALEIQLKTSEVRDQIQEKLREQLEIDPRTKAVGPVIIESVDIGEIHFPKEVAEAIERKSATQEELNRQRYILARTVEEANEKVLKAIAEAKQQLTISSTLDPLYVQYRAIQAYRKISKSDNQTTIILPNSSEGTALPLVLQPKSRRVFTKADTIRIEKELDKLETDLKQKARISETEASSGASSAETPEAEGAEAEGAEPEAAEAEGAEPEAAAPAAAPEKPSAETTLEQAGSP